MQGDPWAHFYWAAIASITPQRARGPDGVSFQNATNAYNRPPALSMNATNAYNQPPALGGATAPTDAADTTASTHASSSTADYDPDEPLPPLLADYDPDGFRLLGQI